MRTQVRCIKVDQGDLSVANIKEEIRRKIDLTGHGDGKWFLVDEESRKPLQDGEMVHSGALLYLVV